ncbi:response regulator [Pleomorphovibrio marinus]|uniref:response regulator n=1 Tax=Pleomorphovibrio marinus TaxID=2164132 RepID=UPI000E0AB59F|nr:response regulator [Pleomorphovibrio marinus]
MDRLIILLVEDNDQDVYLIKEALEDQGFVKKIHHVPNGAKAVSFLKKEKPYEEVEEPNLILMDINMPVMDGHEALKKIKSLERLKHIPIIMLTTSSRKEDILKAYKGQSSSYIVKPDDIFELDTIAETLKNYWTNTVKLPNK